MQTRIPSPHALFRNRFTRPAAEEALASAKTTLTSAKTSAQALLQGGVRLARRPQRRTLGIAAASAAATAGIVAGVTVGTASPAAAVNTHDAVAAVSTTHHAAAAPAAVSHATAAHSAASHSAASHGAISHGAGTHHVAPRHVSDASPAKPHSIYDSVTPSSIPSGKQVATYATGPYAQHVAHGKVMWIDVTGQDYKANALDVEPGDATPAVAATWAQHKLSASPDAIAHIYTMRSEWAAVKAAVAQLPHEMQSHVRWWIADPTGTPHLVPGSQATQWYWGKGYDISTASPGF